MLDSTVLNNIHYWKCHHYFSGKKYYNLKSTKIDKQNPNTMRVLTTVVIEVCRP